MEVDILMKGGKSCLFKGLGEDGGSMALIS